MNVRELYQIQDPIYIKVSGVPWYKKVQQYMQFRKSVWLSCFIKLRYTQRFQRLHIQSPSSTRLKADLSLGIFNETQQFTKEQNWNHQINPTIVCIIIETLEPIQIRQVTIHGNNTSDT